MRTLTSRLLLAGLGVLAVTREKAERMIHELVEKGELDPEEGRSLLTELAKKGKEQAEEWEGRLRADLERALGSLNVATKSDLSRLEARLQRIEELLAARRPE